MLEIALGLCTVGSSTCLRVENSTARWAIRSRDALFCIWLVSFEKLMPSLFLRASDSKLKLEIVFQQRSPGTNIFLRADNRPG